MSFVKYQHLERFGNTEVEGIEIGEVYVFPKLDGTNASVWMDDKGKIKAGSRNRELSYESDNAGFFKYVKENEDKFEKFFLTYPDHRLYGEWLVPHSLTTYREDAWRKFYIFDFATLDYNGNLIYLPYPNYVTTLIDHGFDFLSPIQIIKNGTREHFEKALEKNTYLIQDGKGIGEGIVLKNYDWKNKFGKTIWAKIIANHFKEEHVKVMGASVIGGESIEEKIVDQFVTQHLVDKIYHKIVTEKNGWTSKDIPQLLQTTFYDLVTEETWNIIKKFNNPRIDFSYLNRLTISKVKEIKKELF